MKSKIFCLVAAALLAGCATGDYRTLHPGVQTLGQLRITTEPGWKIVPTSMTPEARSNARTWTKESPTLDRMTVIAGVSDGERLFDAGNVAEVFQATMSAADIEKLLESSLGSVLEGGAASVSTSGLRDQAFGKHGGFMLDIAASSDGGPDYQGMAGGFVDDDRLYITIFLAALPDYFDRHAAEAATVIKSMTTLEPTIGRF